MDGHHHAERPAENTVWELIVMGKVVGDSYVSRIVNSGYSLCPVRYSNPFVRIV